MNEMVPNMHRPNNVVRHDAQSTTNRGVILGGGQRMGSKAAGRTGRAGRDAMQEPSEITFGPNGQIGVNDPTNYQDYDGDFDDSMFEGY